MQMKPNTQPKLSINVNKIATLRNARGGDTPNVLQVSQDLLKFGAEGITVHPRPDGRHIRHQDVLDLAAMLKGRPQEFNVEGYPDQSYLDLVSQVKPQQCTLVPDPPNVITSNAGWNFKKHLNTLKEVLPQLHKIGTRVSLFIDVNTWEPANLEILKSLNADRIELYTESYAKSFGLTNQEKVLHQYAEVAAQVSTAGIGINAGHDLNSQNLQTFAKAIPSLLEVSIGHAFISEALYLGLEKTTQVYLKALKS